MQAYKLDSRASTPRSFDENSTTTTEPKVENKSAFHQLKAEQVKEAVRSWLSSEKEPKKCDVNMLADFFKELALNRKIECLLPMFNFLHRYATKTYFLFFFIRNFVCRNVSKKRCGQWHRAYFEIVNTTQQGMVAMYGNTLLVPLEFPCCNKN